MLNPHRFLNAATLNGENRVASVTIHQLRIFESVARHLSFSEAARELDIVQPAVYLQIKSLEDSCSLSLFIFANNGVQARSSIVVVIVSAKDPLAKKFQLSFAELAQAPLIIKKERRGRPSDVLRQMESQGFGLNILMECESGQAIKTAVMKGMGIGILYRDQVESEVKAGWLKTLRITGLKKINGKSFIVRRRDLPLSRNALDYLALLGGPQQKVVGHGAFEKTG